MLVVTELDVSGPNVTTTNVRFVKSIAKETRLLLFQYKVDIQLLNRNLANGKFYIK